MGRVDHSLSDGPRLFLSAYFRRRGSRCGITAPRKTHWPPTSNLALPRHRSEVISPIRPEKEFGRPLSALQIGIRVVCLLFSCPRTIGPGANTLKLPFRVPLLNHFVLPPPELISSSIHHPPLYFQTLLPCLRHALTTPIFTSLQFFFNSPPSSALTFFHFPCFFCSTRTPPCLSYSISPLSHLSL